MTDTETFTLTLVFDERESARIHCIADAVSDPDGCEYGRHLDRAQLQELVVLSAAERQAIIDWVLSHGMRVLESHGTSDQLMFVQANCAQVLAAFGQDVRRWIEKDADNRGARLELAVPRRLAGYVQKVGGLPGDVGQCAASISGFVGLDHQACDSRSRSAGAPSQAPLACPPGVAGITPAEIREIYSFPSQLDGSGETIALMMLGGDLDPADLRGFWAAHGIAPPDVRTVRVGPQVARPTPALHTLEATLSVQWVGAMVPGARIVVYFIDPVIMGDPWAAFLFSLIGDAEHRPTIASTSWVTPERQYYRLHGHKVITGLLNQAAALGLTVISASGDWGTFDGIPRTIQNGRKVSDAPWPHGTFPAVEERLLSVGGTMITHRDPLTEVGWSGPVPSGQHKVIHFDLLASSGGFSEDVPIPPWQRPALRSYYPRGASTPAVVPYGRGFPDVALMASGPAVQRRPGEALSPLGFRALAGGQWIDFAGGTSLSAPIWAGVIACLNQARRAAGMSRLGFANPLLYKLRSSSPAPFRQITQGASDVIVNAVNMHGQAVPFHLAGFQCTPGWNPVTGLGVPDVAALVELVTTRAQQP